jgi:protein TonB
VARPAVPRSAGKGLWIALAGLAFLGLLVVAGGFWWWSQRAPAAAPPAPPPAVRAARLTVPANTLAGVTVRIDGGPPTELLAPLVRELPAGAHVLTFEAPGTAPQEVGLELKSGETRTQSTPFLVPLPPVAVAPEPVAAPAKPKKPKPVVAVAEPTAPVEAPAPAPEPEPPPTQRGDLVEAGPGVVAPRTVSIPGAKYPERARREKREATIGVLVLVDENGRPVEVKIQDGDPYGVGFDDAALGAVRAARFEPATKDGVQVKMWKVVRVGFRLK